MNRALLSPGVDPDPLTFESIAAHLDLDIDYAYRRAANRHLTVFRQMLAPYNLSRHKLMFHAGGRGVVTLRIGERPWWEVRGGTILTLTLQAIGAKVEAADWNRHLIGVVL